MSKEVISKRRVKDIEIHQYDMKIEAIYRLIEKELSKDNISLITKYDRHMARQSLAKATRLKHLQIVLNLSRMIKKDWKIVTKDDIDNLVFKVVQTYGDNNGKETNTTYDHKKVLKIFFRWVKLGSREHKEVGDPPETKDVRLRPVKNTLVREDLLTKEDYRKLITASDGNPRVKAFVAVHYEAATRPGETLSVRIKDVKFDKFGAIISVDGKTGTRNVRLLKSIPYLNEWINVHPQRDNPDAPLWIQVEGKDVGKAMTYASAKQMIQRLCRKAKIEKRIYLNLFRHTGATSLANSLPESLLRKRQGWTQSSKMPERYVHLIDEDVDEAYLRLHGIIKEDKTIDIKEDMPEKCVLCGCLNMPGNKVCSDCNRPLDIEVAAEMEREEKQKMESKMKTLEDEIRKLTDEKIEEMKKRDEEAEMKRMIESQSLQKEMEKMNKKIEKMKNLFNSEKK